MNKTSPCGIKNEKRFIRSFRLLPTIFLKNFDGDIIRHRQLFRNGIDEKRTTKRLNSFFFFFPKCTSLFCRTRLECV